MKKAEKKAPEKKAPEKKAPAKTPGPVKPPAKAPSQGVPLPKPPSKSAESKEGPIIDVAPVKDAASSENPVFARVEQKALSILDQATSLVAICDYQSEVAAVEFRNKVLKKALNDATDLLEPFVRSAKKLYDDARDRRDKFLEPFKQADRLILDAVATYRKHLEEQRRREEEAARKEQLENERLAAIERAKEKEQQRAELVSQLDSLPEDAPEELVDEFLAQIAALDGTPLVASTPSAAVQISKPVVAGGMALTDNWKGYVTDGKKVLEAIVAGELPITLIQFNAPELNRLAKVYRDTKKIPGLEFRNEQFVRGTGR